MKNCILFGLTLLVIQGMLLAQSSNINPMTRQEIVALAKKQVGNIEMIGDAKLVCTVWLLSEPWKTVDFVTREVDWTHLKSLKDIKAGDVVAKIPCTAVVEDIKLLVYLGLCEDDTLIFVTSSPKGGVLVNLKWCEVLESTSGSEPCKCLGIRRNNIKEVEIVEGPTGTRSFSAPFYAQCDSRWGSDKMGGGSTLCQAGCLVTSMSMSTTGPHYDPGDFNQWLKDNGGYSGNLFIWGSVDGYFGLNFVSRISSRPAASDLRTWLDWGRIIVANVNGGGHWVLLLDHDGGTKFKCNDPGTSSGANKWINHTDIVGIGMYQR